MGWALAGHCALASLRLGFETMAVGATDRCRYCWAFAIEFLLGHPKNEVSNQHHLASLDWKPVGDIVRFFGYHRDGCCKNLTFDDI